MIRLFYRRAFSAACLMIVHVTGVHAQQTYQSPPADLVKILEAPANPVISVSPSRQWVLVTVNDPRTVTISDMADSAYYLAGSKIRANPDYRVENIGIRSATLSSAGGDLERVIPVPPDGRIGNTAWSTRDNRLAYTTISNGKTALDIYYPTNPARIQHIVAPGLSGRIRDLSWSREGAQLAFTETIPAGTALWVADVVAGKASRITPPTLNFTTARGNIVDDPGCDWLNGQAPLVCRLWPANRSAPPNTSGIPTGATSATATLPAPK
jgi:hypothetical protein